MADARSRYDAAPAEVFLPPCASLSGSATPLIAASVLETDRMLRSVIFAPLGSPAGTRTWRRRIVLALSTVRDALTMVFDPGSISGKKIPSAGAPGASNPSESKSDITASTQGPVGIANESRLSLRLLG